MVAAPQIPASPPRIVAAPPRPAFTPPPQMTAPSQVTAPLQRTIPAQAAGQAQTAAPARPSAPPPTIAPQPARRPAPVVDSTQTIRALTALELSDDEVSRWFVIQLMLSEQPIDPSEVPNLDIFVEYRLYSVAGIDQDGIRHALRLGFFSSESAAQAVAGYIGTFFDSPCVKRISIAEHDRFEEGRLEAGKDVGATGVHAVIELSGPKPLPDREIQPVAKVRDSDEGGDDPEPGSLWSRLLPSRRR
jgi:hypothetical protein